MDFEVFETTLLLDYGIEMSEFWKEQYRLYQNGVRDVRIHDNTLVIMGG